jgi:hypothetical protein
LPKLKWLVNGENYSEKKLEILTDEPFVLSLVYKNGTLLNHILVMKMDNPRKLIKYECILNDNVTIREHFVQVIDEKPRLDVSLDKSMLNKFKLAFKIGFKQPFDSSLVSGVEMKHLKLFILYAENATFNSAYQTVIAPGRFFIC